MFNFQLTILIIIIIFIIGVLYILDKNLKNLNTRTIINTPIIEKPYIEKHNKDVVKEYDEKKINDVFEAPAKRPERTQMGYNPIMKVSNNPLEPFPTRGYPDNYHLMGTLTAINEENEEGYNKLEQDNKIISLFGRQKYPGSSEYEYYTMLSTGNMMTKIPISKDYKRELFNDDEIEIKEIGKKYKVNMYPNEEMKYNPFLF